ncbi:MAG: YggS family pyridoxal phosphate-dependent enzyme [Alphaproteobacteria bacterium]|nr:YggS family pyridoxal phosphate-dependent enzyme [Alphaproteobacteria bacterium]
MAVAAELASAVDIAANLARVRAEIAAAARAAGRAPETVTLVAVSKTQPAEAARGALAAGQRVFGENRVQEAEAKYPALKAECPDLQLHLIGSLQSNKARAAVALFDVIETVDRPKLARKLAAEMAALNRWPRLFIEVNAGGEAQKGGVLPAEADALVALCREELKLPLDGLMCIPPLDQEPSPHFALLAKIARRNGLAKLSMGMSADYPVAVALGATHVRVGTAIFGPRRAPL